MRDAARRGGRFDLVVSLEALESVPQAHASAEQDRDHHDMHVVDEPRGKELADHGGASAEAHILTGRGLTRRFERLGRRGIDEVEGRAALHLDRRARVMCEDEYGCVERRVRSPRALPVRIFVPSWMAKLAGAHDLGADSGLEQPREGVIDATAAARPLPGPPPSSKHPFVQPVAGVTKMCVAALTLASAETVERDREVVDTDE